VKYREIARKLRKLGCDELPHRGGGSHRKWHHPNKGVITSIPDWGNKDLKPGTLRQIIRDPGLDWDEFTKS
jgi:mRNA interferase HicA